MYFMSTIFYEYTDALIKTVLHLEQQLQSLTAQLHVQLGQEEAVNSTTEAAEESKETGGDSDGSRCSGAADGGEVGQCTAVTNQLQRQLLQAQEVLNAAQNASAEATSGE